MNNSIQKLIDMGIWSLFKAKNPPKESICYVLVTDLIIDGNVKIYWLDKNFIAVNCDKNTIDASDLGGKHEKT